MRSGVTPEYSVSSPCSRRYTAFRRQWRWSQWWTGSIQRRSLGRSVVVSGRGFCDGRKIHDARIVGSMEVGCWGSYPGYSSRKFSCDDLRCLRQKPYNAMNGILFFDEDSLCSAVSPHIGQYSDRCTRLHLLVRFINRSNSFIWMPVGEISQGANASTSGPNRSILIALGNKYYSWIDHVLYR